MINVFTKFGTSQSQYKAPNEDNKEIPSISFQNNGPQNAEEVKSISRQTGTELALPNSCTRNGAELTLFERDQEDIHSYRTALSIIVLIIY